MHDLPDQLDAVLSAIVRKSKPRENNVLLQ
jgi:hypothetical protein